MGGGREDLFILFLLTSLWALVSRRRWRKFRQKEEAGTGQGSCSPQCFGLFVFFHSLLDQPPREPREPTPSRLATVFLLSSGSNPSHVPFPPQSRTLFLFSSLLLKVNPQNYNVLHVHPCSFRRAEAFPGLLCRNSLKNSTSEGRQKFDAFRPKTDSCIDVYYYKLDYIL